MKKNAVVVGGVVFLLAAVFRVVIRSFYTSFSGAGDSLLVSSEFFQLNALADILNVIMLGGMLTAILGWFSRRDLS